MRNILIIGGAGFVGSSLACRLLEEPEVEKVVIFDNFSSGKRHHLPLFSGARLDVIQADAADIGMLKTVMSRQQFDTVFHLAANPDIARAVTEPTIDFDQGTVLTKNVLEAMRQTGAGRLIYFSGSGVYGDCGSTFVNEDTPCRPISCYGAAKLAGEAMIHAYHHMFGIDALIFRPANIVGPRQTHGVGFDFIRKLRADPTRLEVLGNGQQSKSYIHIDDVLNAVIGCVHLQESGEAGRCETFNLAADDYLTVEEIARMAVDEVVGAFHSPEIFYRGGRGGWKGDVPVVRFDCARLFMAGWRCQRTSAQAMRDALAALNKEP